MGDALSEPDPSRPRALLAADARREAGLGHLARCTALACALREQGFELETIGLGAPADAELDRVIWRPESSDAAAGPESDLLVLDTYDESQWSRLAAIPHGRLVAFADALPDPGAADVAIAPAGDIAAHEGTRVLAGLRYACLRKGFWDLPPRAVREPARRVLVTTGGGDPAGLAGRIAADLAGRFPQVEVELVRGPGFDGEAPPGVTVLERPRSLLEPLLRADVVVCAGGQTMLEAAATGAPAVVLEAAVNQRAQIGALAARDAIVAVEEGDAAGAVERLLASTPMRGELSCRAQGAVDGRGASRVASELAN